jgi:hypothetical protein
VHETGSHPGIVVLLYAYYGFNLLVLRGKVDSMETNVEGQYKKNVEGIIDLMR